MEATVSLKVSQESPEEFGILSPQQLFNNKSSLDGLLQQYISIKSGYCAEWKKYESFKLLIQKSPKIIKSSKYKASVSKLKHFHHLIHQCLSTINASITSTLASFPSTPKLMPQLAPFAPTLTPLQSFTPSPALITRSSTDTYTYAAHAHAAQGADSPLLTNYHCESEPESFPESDMNLPTSEKVMQRYKVRKTFSRKTEEKEYESTAQNDDDPQITSIGPLGKMQSLRSFGAMFSKEFQLETVHNYEDSIAPKTMPVDKNEDFDHEKHIKVVQYFHDNYYGQNEVFESPFGFRPVIYCDWTASGKILQCVETYLAKEMYTLYANTHTTTSITGIQTSKFRSEARTIILSSLGGDPTEDVVLFTGSGVTGAIYKMAGILMSSLGKCYRAESSVVFISVYEHNSNIYIWKELGINVIVIPEHEEFGGLDLDYLEKKLKKYTSSPLKYKYNLLIGSFTAASNVSGIIAPIDKTTALLHTYGALSFWDYATAGPYLDVNMTNCENPHLSKDAVFISTHKYLAGPGAPGILCAKKELFQNYIPVIPGGGTVFAAYGIEEGQWQYLYNIEEREEGGTPDIIGSVRAAFAFMIKDHLSTKFITNKEDAYLSYFLSETKNIKNLVMMGNIKCHRLPVLSFMVEHTSTSNDITKYLHHNYIAALLNDLFGIQGRGGCACAGMYGIKVLDLSMKQVDDRMEQVREDRNELCRPGYFRINLHYTLNDNEIKYIVNAVRFVCEHGWKLLPLYDINKKTGNYFHRDIKRKPELLKKQLRSLLDISFDENNGTMKWIERHMRVDGKRLNDNLDKFLIAAHDFVGNLKKYLPTKDVFDDEDKVDAKTAWYWLPSELYGDVLNLCKT